MSFLKKDDSLKNDLLQLIHEDTVFAAQCRMVPKHV